MDISPVFSLMSEAKHQILLFCNNSKIELKAIVAIQGICTETEYLAGLPGSMIGPDYAAAFEAKGVFYGITTILASKKKAVNQISDDARL